MRRALAEARLARAIGVICRPETDRMRHYSDADLPRRFFAIIRLDDTTALRDLEPREQWERGVEEPPEMFPTGI